MDLTSIYLVENLSNYNFEDVVFLAADINAIVEALLQPIVLKDVEKVLFLGKLLKTVLHICRTVVCNYTTLEELLKVNWSSSDDYSKKWRFFEKLSLADPVHVIAKRILLSKDGEKCLGIMQEFFQLHYSKEAFKQVLQSVQKSIPSIASLAAYQTLRKTISGTDITNETTLNSKEIDIVALANHTTSNDFRKLAETLQAKLNGSDNEELLKVQMRALKSLFHDTTSMERYQVALKSDSYYQLNLALLKFYHDHLLTKNILYDTNIIMLLYLLRQNGAHDALLREEFFNETRLGGPERMRILLLELQNFS
uniref:Uncharacterized protein n=1 Tax=Anopheles culicifacies TaxID=139723 RepID=A0A182M274_9DIPT